MKIALAQQNYHIGNFGENCRKILEGIRQAKQAGADLVVFSELSVCGYPPRDFLEFEDFIRESDAAIDRIRQEADTIGVIVGAPARNARSEGKSLHNAAWLLYEKEIKGIAHKTCLPTYDVFDEYRYFEPGFDWQVIPFKGIKIALTICEDIWTLGENPLYRVCPMDKLIGQQPDCMINISASPFDYEQCEVRGEVVRQNALKYGLPMFYCNTVGSQTEIVFDGGSLVYGADGSCLLEMSYFEEDFACVALPEAVPPLFLELLPGLSVALGHKGGTESGGTEGTAKESAEKENNGKGRKESNANENRGEAAHTGVQELLLDKEMKLYSQSDPEKILPNLVSPLHISRIYQALLTGIRDYFRKMGFSKAILGSSGGIDSAVTLALACQALGKEKVRAILMPSPYSSGHSVSDAEQLSVNLGNPHDIVPIRDVYETFLKTLQPLFNDLPFGIAEENIQSRTRGNLLMAITNKFGYILLNTSNKSELSTGYGTLYGDMAGGLSVLGDVYKTQVFALAEYINREKEIIPSSILTKAPSAELRPDQKDSDSLPEYDILDKVLYQYIEKRQGPREIVSMGFDEALVNRILRMVNANEYKRNQFCPIIRVSGKAFGVGRRVPIVGKYLG